MEIELWGIEFNKRKNSTKIPTTQGITKEVVLKEHCSTMSPSFFVTGAVGYSYLKAWDNYYWITNIGFDINGHEYIDCTIDVLASWRSIIQNSTFFVDRCADSSYYNTDIFDEALSIEDGAEVSSSATTNVFNVSGGSGSWLITVLGTGTTGLNVYGFSGPPPASIFCPLFDMDVSGNQPFLDAIADIPKAIIALVKTTISDPSKYVVSLKYSPLPLSYYGGSSETIYVGWQSSSATGVKIPSAVSHQTFTLSKPSNIYTDFRKTDSRCSMYTLYLPGVGTVELSPDIIELSLTLRVSFDYQSGGVHYKLMADGSCVATYDGCIYADSGYGGASINSGAISQTVAGIGAMVYNSADKTMTVTDKLTGVSTDVTRRVPTNPLHFSLGMLTAIHGIGSVMKPQASLANPIGSKASIQADPLVIISAIQKHTAEFLTNDYGRPCCKNLRLGLLNGFIRCANASIDISSTDGIREDINTYLNTGFFME